MFCIKFCSFIVYSWWLGCVYHWKYCLSHHNELLCWDM